MLRKFLLGTLLAIPMVAVSQNSTPEEPMPPVPSYLVARDLDPEIIEAERKGDFMAADQLIMGHLTQNSIDGKKDPLDPYRIELQRLGRVRRDYSLGPETLLKTLQADIPDATLEDLERWRAAGLLQGITYDNQVRYFRKEPRNLYRASKEARDRRAAAAKQAPAAAEADPNARKTTTFDLHEHVENVLAATDKSGKATAIPVKIHAKYKIMVDAGAVPEGETIRCWIPFPQEYERQRDITLIASSSENPIIADSGVPMRTVHMLAAAAPPDQKTEFWIEYVYTTSAYAPKIQPEKVKILFPNHPVVEKYIQSQPPHVDLNPEVRALAKEIAGDEKNPYKIAEKIFRWMDENIQYCSEMEYSTFTSITDKAMTDRRGDCGIFALTFIALCRANGVPARWQSGWAMRPGNENMHDWAEFYVEPYGWLTADPSFGLRRHDNPRVRDFYIGHVDAYRMIANLDYAAEFTPPKESWRSDNIDNQRGEVEWSGGNLYYDKWTYEMKVDYEFLDEKTVSEANLDNGAVTHIDSK